MRLPRLQPLTKKDLHIAVWTVLGVGVIGLFTFGGMTLYKTYQANLVLGETVRDLNISLQATSESLADLRAEVGGSLVEARSANEKLSESIKSEQALRLQGETVLRSKVDEVTREAAKSKPVDVSAVIEEWRPRIAYITCRWSNGDTVLGSGLLLGSSSGDFQIQTNRHVVYDESTSSGPNSCNVKLPGDSTIAAKEVSIKTSSSADSAIITIDEPTSKMSALSSSIISKACSAKPNVGDPVVILGYPLIGSSVDITATEGIISGFEGNYFITSAKIEQGNSGGAAISLKYNCYLGIPTLTKVGRIEALGRILDWRTLGL